MIGGGIAGAIGGAVLLNSFCNSGESADKSCGYATVAGAVIGGAVVGVTFLFIGSMIKK